MLEKHIEEGHSDLEKENFKANQIKEKDTEINKEKDSEINKQSNKNMDETEGLLFDEIIDCKIFKKTFSHASNLKRHNENVHSSKRKRPIGSDDRPAKILKTSLQCHICSKVLSRSDKLRNRIRSQHNK